MTLETLFIILLVGSLLAGILSGLPVVFVLLGVPLIVSVVASAFGAFDLDFLKAFPQRIFGLTSNTLLIAVPLFVAMGILLERSGAAERMLLMMARMLGGARSGLTLAVLLVSTLIAASTGIIGATIVMLGLISLPAMTRAGVPVRLSSGLVCASGTLGQIIPPSIVLILLGDQISNTWLEAQHASGNFAPEPVSVADVFAGALMPGLMLVGLYALYVLFYTHLVPVSRVGPDVVPKAGKAARHEAAAQSARKDAAVSRVADVSGEALDEAITPSSICRVFLPPLLLIISVLGSILAGVATPTEAAAVGAAGALLLAGASQPGQRVVSSLALLAVIAAAGLLFLNQQTRLPAESDLHLGLTIGLLCLLLSGLGAAAVALWKCQLLSQVFHNTVMVTAMVFGIIVGASMLSLVFRGFGGDELITDLLQRVPGNEYGMLALVMLVVFLLGFILEFVEIIFIVVPIVGPTLLAGNFDPVWIAVLFAMNLQTSFLTPPFGFALFYFRDVAPPSMSTREIYRAVLPFVGLQLIGLGLVVAFPGIATWLPSVLD